jgi:SAM-dependent methyltransferase
MHRHSFDSMTEFRSRYLEARRNEPLTVIDLGSADLNGSYRELFAIPPWRYLGADLVSSENVDIVLRDPYRWREIDSESIDVVVSGQTFEHTEFFWETMLEIARVLKPLGMCCIIAPSCGPEHRFSRDCWRIFADGFSAVARYAGLEVVDVQTQWGDLPDYDSESNKWHDSVLIARKPVRPFATRLRWQIHSFLKRLVPPPAPAPETIVQIFHSQDGNHTEANSMTTRIGHEAWKEISIPLPRGAGAAPLRIDFMSDLTVIDVASIEVETKTATLFRASDPESFKTIAVAGDAQAIPHPEYLRLRVTGIDPQLILPGLPPVSPDETVEVKLRLRVVAASHLPAPEQKNATP